MRFSNFKNFLSEKSILRKKVQMQSFFCSKANKRKKKKSKKEQFWELLEPKAKFKREG